MANQSDFMKNRLKKNYTDKITTAKSALIIVGVLYLVISALMFVYNKAVISSIINAGFAFGLIALGQWSRHKPVLAFQIGVGVSVFIAMLGLLSFRLLAVGIFALLAHRVYMGIEAARYIEALAPPSPDDNILDAALYED